MRFRLERLELMRGASASLSALVLALSAAGCDAGPSPDPSETSTGGAQAPAAIQLTDAAGREHVLEGPAHRVVSLVPSATEALAAIGARSALVGVTDYDEAEWTRELPSVGGGLEPNLEALVALAPDVVIRFHGDQDPRTPERLDELGIRHVAVRPVTLEDVYETNHIVGALVGKAGAADSLSAAIRGDLESLTRAVAELPRQNVVYMLGGSPPWVSGPDTYISQILERVGGDNVFADLGAPYQAVSPEELRARNIDVVLVAAPGSYDTSLTPGARIEVAGDALQVPGPGVVEEARSMAALIHGRPVR